MLLLYKLSFRMYVEPFHKLTWVFIIFNGLVLCICIRLYMYFKKFKLPRFSMILLYIGKLTEGHVSLPRELYNLSWLRLVVEFWLLESSVILSVYTSKLTSDPNAPIKGNPIQNLSDVFRDPLPQNDISEGTI